MMSYRPGSPFWMVFYGVDATHLTECVGVFDRLKDARVAYDALELEHPFKVKILQRITQEPHTIKTLHSETTR